MITTGSAPKALRPSKPKKPRVPKVKSLVKTKKPRASSGKVKDGKKETMLEKLLKEK